MTSEIEPSHTTVTAIAPILVGIDGTAASWDAVSWAEEDLAARSTIDGPRRLVMCRTYARDEAGARLPNPPDMAWLALADPGLARRLRQVRQRLITDDIALTVHTGDLADHLIAAATADAMVVVAAPQRDIAVATRVAAHAAGVVVAVRATTPPPASPLARSPATSWSGSATAPLRRRPSSSPSRTPIGTICRSPPSMRTPPIRPVPGWMTLSPRSI